MGNRLACFQYPEQAAAFLRQIRINLQNMPANQVLLFQIIDVWPVGDKILDDSLGIYHQNSIDIII